MPFAPGMGLPRELQAAVTEALDQESVERDDDRRAELLAATRRVLDDWVRRHVSTADAVASLASSHAR